MSRSIVESNRAYESWLRSRLTLLPADITRKHEKMARSAFSFLRGTFFRWIEVWPQLCPTLADAPRVLCVGDIHVENFGTWRDADGRLAWGVNDFDEAEVLPYTNDLRATLQQRDACARKLAVASARARNVAACLRKRVERLST